jgi:hypothetical protein
MSLPLSVFLLCGAGVLHPDGMCEFNAHPIAHDLLLLVALLFALLQAVRGWTASSFKAASAHPLSSSPRHPQSSLTNLQQNPQQLQEAYTHPPVNSRSQI